MPNEGLGLVPIADNEQNIVKQPKNTDDKVTSAKCEKENQVPMASLRRLRDNVL